MIPAEPAVDTGTTSTNTMVFFKIFGKSMSHHVLHKDLRLGNGDAFVQVYDDVITGNSDGDGAGAGTEVTEVLVSPHADTTQNIALMSWSLVLA